MLLTLLCHFYNIIILPHVTMCQLMMPLVHIFITSVRMYYLRECCKCSRGGAMVLALILYIPAYLGVFKPRGLLVCKIDFIL